MNLNYEWPTAALSVDQPFASLLVHGKKRWETRPLSPGGNPGSVASARPLPGLPLRAGSTLMIHATARAARRLDVAGLGSVPAPGRSRWRNDDGSWFALERGVLLGVVRFVRAVPIVTHEAAALIVANENHDSLLSAPEGGPPGEVVLWEPGAEPVVLSPAEVAVGAFAPGRWGWEVEPLGRLIVPASWKGAQVLWRCPAPAALDYPSLAPANQSV